MAFKLHNAEYDKDRYKLLEKVIPAHPVPVWSAPSMYRFPSPLHAPADMVFISGLIEGQAWTRALSFPVHSINCIKFTDEKKQTKNISVAVAGWFGVLVLVPCLRYGAPL